AALRASERADVGRVRARRQRTAPGQVDLGRLRRVLALGLRVPRLAAALRRVLAGLPRLLTLRSGRRRRLRPALLGILALLLAGLGAHRLRVLRLRWFLGGGGAREDEGAEEARQQSVQHGRFSSGGWPIRWPGRGSRPPRWSNP